MFEPESQTIEYKYKTLTVTFFNVNKNDPVNDPVNDRQNIILQSMKSNPNISRETLAELTSTSVATIRRDIAKLKKLGRIERVGSDKTGHWKITSHRSSIAKDGVSK